MSQWSAGWRFALVLRVVGVAIGAWALIDPPDHPGNESRWRRFVTPAVTIDQTLSQTFRMESPNLEAIALRPRRTGEQAGALRFQLVDFDRNGDGEPRVVRAADVRSSTMTSTDSYRFQFDAIQDSNEHIYRLDVAPAPGTIDSGVGFVATKGDRYGDGTLLANDRERWADLIFQTGTPAMSPLAALISGRYLSRGAVLTVFALLVVSWPAVSKLLREVGTPDPGA